MITKNQVKKEIDRLSNSEVEKVYLYLTSLKKSNLAQPNIRSLKLSGSLDHKNLRELAYE
jgi:hypothetical protein